jgi:hypothetical protein
MLQSPAGPEMVSLTVPIYVLRAVNPAIEAETALEQAVERQATRLQSLAAALARWRHAQPTVSLRELNGAIYTRLHLAVDSPEYQRVAKVLSRAWARVSGKESERNHKAPESGPAPIRLPDEQVRALVSDRALPKDAKRLQVPRPVNAAIRAFNDALRSLKWHAVVEVRAAEVRIHVTPMT